MSWRSMVRNGLGVAVLPCYLADRDDGLRRIESEFPLDIKFDMWILYHPDVRRLHRVRLFADFVADAVRQDRDLFEGRRPIT